MDYDRDLGNDTPPKAPEPAEAFPRRVYITRQTSEKYGYTPECWSQPHRVLPDANRECDEG